MAKKKVSIEDIDILIKKLLKFHDKLLPPVELYRDLIYTAIRIEDGMSEDAVRKEYGQLTVGEWIKVMEVWRGEKLVESRMKSVHKWTTYEFIDYLLRNKCIDDMKPYVGFDITQEEFDDTLHRMGFDYRILKKENSADTVDGLASSVYQYKIDGEIYRIWVNETGYVFDGCLKY